MALNCGGFIHLSTEEQALDQELVLQKWGQSWVLTLLWFSLWLSQQCHCHIHSKKSTGHLKRIIRKCFVFPLLAIFFNESSGSTCMDVGQSNYNLGGAAKKKQTMLWSKITKPSFGQSECRTSNNNNKNNTFKLSHQPITACVYNCIEIMANENH